MNFGRVFFVLFWVSGFFWPEVFYFVLRCELNVLHFASAIRLSTIKVNVCNRNKRCENLTLTWTKIFNSESLGLDKMRS